MCYSVIGGGGVDLYPHNKDVNELGIPIFSAGIVFDILKTRARR
jgi:hypothetical protein